MVITALVTIIMMTNDNDKDHTDEDNNHEVDNNDHDDDDDNGDDMDNDRSGANPGAH